MTVPGLTGLAATRIVRVCRPSSVRRRQLHWAAVLSAALFALLPSISIAAETESESGGIAALGFNLPGLVSNFVGFLILLLLLRVFLWDRILSVLDERRERISEGLSQAEQAASRAAASEDESRRIMEEARTEGRDAVQRAQEAADRLRVELEERAREEAEQIVSRSRQELQAERDRAIQQLHQEFADLTVEAAERVIGQSLDRTAHQRLIDEVLLGSQFSVGEDGQNGTPPSDQSSQAN